MNRSREGKDDEVFSAEQAAAFQTNNARVLSIFMERYLLKFHWSTRVEDTSVFTSFPCSMTRERFMPLVALLRTSLNVRRKNLLVGSVTKGTAFWSKRLMTRY